MFINNIDQLKQFYQECQKDKKIAIDTEFYWVSTYKPELCLIQIANTKRTILIDTIKHTYDLELVKKLLQSNKILKVFHSARQDLEIFYNLFKIIPKKIFDIQIAVVALGYNLSTSLKQICQDFVNIDLKKQEQRCDWRARPLSKKQINYAINDVEHLLFIHTKIKNKLLQMNRQGWINDLHKKLLNKNNYSKKHLHIWEKIKFEPKDYNELYLLKKISNYREVRAIELNKSPKKIMSNNVIINLCKKSVDLTSKDNLLKKIDDEVLKKKISALLERIKQKKISDSNFDTYNKVNLEKTLKKAVHLVSRRAKKLNVHPSLIANKKEIKQLIISEKKLKISCWKRKILGKSFFKEISFSSSSEFSL